MSQTAPCYCQEPDGVSYQCPGNTCQPGYPYCWSDVCDDPSLADSYDCAGQPGDPGCEVDNGLPMIPGVDTGSYCQGGQGGSGSGYGNGGTGGIGCYAPGGIIVAVWPLGDCEGGMGGKGGSHGKPGVGGAGCEAYIVIEVDGCHAGPGGRDCVAELYAGTTCGVGGDIFCQTGVPTSGNCQVVPGAIIFCTRACNDQSAFTTEVSSAAGSLP
jgi:hypothetical protein